MFLAVFFAIFVGKIYGCMLQISFQNCSFQVAPIESCLGFTLKVCTICEFPEDLNGTNENCQNSTDWSACTSFCCQETDTYEQTYHDLSRCAGQEINTREEDVVGKAVLHIILGIVVGTIGIAILLKIICCCRKKDKPDSERINIEVLGNDESINQVREARNNIGTQVVLQQIQIQSIAQKPVFNLNGNLNQYRENLSSPAPLLARWQPRRDPIFEQNSSCPICLQPQPLMTLPCGHSLHLTCAKDWLCRKMVCPLCKRQIGFSNMLILSCPCRASQCHLHRRHLASWTEENCHKCTQK